MASKKDRSLLPKRTITRIVDLTLLKTRGKNSPFKDRKLYGKVLMTLHGGRVVFCAHPRDILHKKG